MTLEALRAYYREAVGNSSFRVLGARVGVNPATLHQFVRKGTAPTGAVVEALRGYATQHPLGREGAAAPTTAQLEDILRAYREEMWTRAGQFAADIFAAAVEGQRQALGKAIRDAPPDERADDYDAQLVKAGKMIAEAGPPAGGAITRPAADAPAPRASRRRKGAAG